MTETEQPKTKGELELRAEWFAEARDMTLEKLPAFIDKLVAHPHDYGTICRAIAAAAVGAAWAVERSPAGGITGFQAGCVMWDMITGWMTEYEGKPVRILDYEKMLYPQHDEDFTTISEETRNHLRRRAMELMSEHKDAKGVHPDVFNHWQKVAAGHIPFGYSVRV